MTSKKDIDQLIKRINDTPGFVVPESRTSSCHRRAFRADRDGNPVGRGVTLPGTPGDFNQLHTTRRKLRRNIGWHDPLAKTNQQRKKKRRGKETQTMPEIKDVARVVRFDDGRSESRPPAASTPAASTSSRPPAASTPADNRPAVASTAPAASTPAASTSPPRPPIGTANVREVARYMWGRLQTKAAAPDARTTYEGAPGWQWTGRLGDEMKEAYPELAGLPKKEFTYLVNRVRSILTSSRRVVSLKAGNPVTPSVFFVRDGGNSTSLVNAAPAEVPAPVPAPAPPADSAPTGNLTPRNESMSGQGEVETTARDLPKADADKPRRIGVEDLLGFLGEHDALLQERREVEAFAEEVATYSAQLNRAANALLEKLRGRRDGSP